MNAQIIAKNVIIKHIFSILSILCEKLLLLSNTKDAKTIPITTIGAIIVEWKNVVINPTNIIPIATNPIK